VRAEVIPAVLVIILGAVVAGGAVHSAGARKHRRDALAAQQLRVTRQDSARGVTRKEIVPEGQTQAIPPDEMRRRVANLAGGTYVGDILAEQDSVLYRWPERLSDAVRVWIEPTSAVADWSSGYPAMTRGVFDEWSLAGFPLRFTFVFDSTNADISIRWLDRFPDDAGQRIGETERVHTSAALIATAHVSVATHDSAGRALSPTVIAGVVRHEVGHALGLNHANDSSSVMFRESATATIGASDRATLRLLYLVPAGSLKRD
jgi:predicted Zn-dependent protease